MTESSQNADLKKGHGAFHALSFPNYRLWYVGQMISVFGTWMQSTAQGYLVFELTQSTGYLGIVSFAQGLPVWLFMFSAGVLIDRVRRRRLLMVTQSIMMLLAFALGFLAFTGLVQAWHIVVLAFLLGTTNAFDAPGRQSFVLEMVDRGALDNAIALNSTMFNVATAIGPAVGGLIYSLVGPGWCFTLNGISFIAVIVALGLMRFAPGLEERPIHAPRRNPSPLKDLVEGLRYIRGHRRILTVIAIVSVFSCFGWSLVAFYPSWSVEVLAGDSTTNGLLQSSRGLGAFCCAVFLAIVSKYKIRGRIFMVGLVAIPIAVAFFALMNVQIMGFVASFIIGVTYLLLFNNANGLVQSMVEDRLRGRVMAVYMCMFLGLAPIGSFIAGWLAEAIGQVATVLCYAGILAAATVVFQIFTPYVRRLE